MYEEYFGLVEAPFDLSTNPRFLYMSPGHSRAKAYLDYAVYKGDGLVVITGEIGVGKSTLIHELAATGHERAEVIVIRQPQTDSADFLRALLLELGREELPGNKAELLAAVNYELGERFVWGRRTTLIIDEAQTLPCAVLEELRMLADAQIGAQKPLAIVLVGQPCLRERLAGDAMEQFRQRVRLSFHLSRLDRDETRGYLEKRLDVAGASPGPWPIFRDDAIAPIYHYTGGVPRLINVLADLALTAAYLDGADSVTAEQVESAVEELGWVSYARRRRQATLALPGLGWRARWQARLAEYRDRAAHGAAQLGGRIADSVTELRSKLPTRLRSAGERARTALRFDSARPGTWRQALRAKLRRDGVRGGRVLAALRARAGDRAWLRPNLARGAVVLFIAALTAGVVVTGSSVEAPEGPVELPIMTAMETERVEAPQALPGPGAAAAEDTARSGARTAPPPDRALGGPPPAVRLRPTTHFMRTAQPAVPEDAALPAAAEPVVEPVTTGPSATTPSPAPPSALRFEASNQPAAAGLADAGWLLEQDAGDYVVQIFAARSPEVVERFLLGQARELDLAYYRRIRGGDEWHVLVAGPYESYPSARQATAGFPAEVRRTGPWVRSVAEVQADIRAAGGELQARALP